MARLTTEFSESSYAFSFTENLINGGILSARASPQFLSTRAEGGGSHWDVHIPALPVAFFFQFKIPSLMQRGSRLQNGAWLRRPFYRMNLRSEHAYAQHHGLLNLEQSGANIYYVSPRFHTGANFNQFFLDRNIPEHSAWFRPTRATPPDYRSQHGIAYDFEGKVWEMRSPRPAFHDENCNHERFLKDWSEAVARAPQRSRQQFIEALVGKIDLAITAVSERIMKAEKESLIEERKTSKVLFDKIVTSQSELSFPSSRNVDPLLNAVSRARAQLGLEILIGGLS
jgi:hypothetical protein